MAVWDFVRLLATATIALLVAQPILAEPPAGKRYAVLVGVKEYQHADLDRLRYPENDVVQLGKVLEQLGYQILSLTDREGAKVPERRPTRANIDRAVKATLKRTGRSDVVVVALAGHGIQPDGSADSYFCPVDANPSVFLVEHVGRSRLRPRRRRRLAHRRDSAERQRGDQEC